MDLTEQLAYDIRIIERNITKGKLTQKDYEKHLQSLVDQRSNAESVSVEAIQEEEDDEED